MPPDDLGAPRTEVGLERTTAPQLTQRLYRGAGGASALRSDLEPLVLGSLEVSALQPGRALALDLSTTVFEGLALSKGVMSASRSVYTASQPDNDGVLMMGATHGRSLIRQGGREAEASNGEAFFVDLTRPYELLAQPMHACAIRLSRTLLQDMYIDVDAALMSPVRGGHPALDHLMRYADVVHDSRAIATPQMRRAIATHVHDLASLLAGATGGAAQLARQRGGQAARVAAVRADINAHLTEPALSAAAVAQRLGISARYVHRLLEGEGKAFSAVVMELRLALAARLLGDPRLSRRTIAAIAFDAGFGDLSYFNRSFRQRYGMTPSDARTRAERRTGSD